MVVVESVPEKEAFGRLLRQYREQAGLGQERLAERAGLSVPAISNLERGVNRPRLETVRLLAEALALPAGERAALLAAVLRERTDPQPSSPPVSPTAPPRQNLPVAPNALVGRERELAAVWMRLQDPTLRLLTLTGVGGVGKTRLALAVAADLVDSYPDGVWLVQLAPLADPALVPSAVAGVLGLQEEANQPLVAHLRDQQLLLVLDNCEHLLASCAELAGALLRACPGVRILATSRERLGVSGEQVYQVPPLCVPDLQHLPPLDVMDSYTAVRLFVARAQARQHEFALGDHNMQAVVTICKRLDGLPLALELAAARVGSLPVAAIAARLDERFGLLTLGPRDVLPRQQTLRATMDWSWDLLGDQERMLLRRLSVFAGDWTLAAAEAAGAGEGIEGCAVLDLVDGLVSKSLVQVDHKDGDEERYHLLETVRQYACERLAEAGEGDAVRDRHLSWYVALTEMAEPHLSGPEQGAWLARLEHEHDNLRAALRWAFEQLEHERGLRLAGALWRFWYTRGHLTEGRGWLELAATPACTIAVPAELRAKALYAAGNLNYEQGEYGRAVALHEVGLALRRALGDKHGIAASLNSLGNIACGQGEYDRAAALYQESLALRRALGDKSGIAASLSNLGIVADLQGDYGRAVSLHEEGLALRRELGDGQSIATSLNNLGIVAKKQGNYRRAAAFYEESLAFKRALEDRSGVAAALSNLGIVATKQGDYGRAVELLEESLALERELGDTKGIAVSLGSLGIVAHAQGAYERAAVLHEEALALCHTLGDRHGIAGSLSGLGTVAYMQCEYGQAAALLKDSLLLGREIGARDMVAEVLESLAWVAAARDLPYRALQLAGAAETLRQVLGVPLAPERWADHEEAMHVTRAALGESAFVAAWAHGQALSFEEAVTLALEGHNSAPLDRLKPA